LDNKSFTIDGNLLKSNAIFDYESRTSYSVNIEVGDGKLKFTKAFVISINDILETTGFSNTSESNVRVFPNPFSNVIFIENLNDTKVTISVYDISGKLVHEKLNTLSGKGELELKPLKKGGVFFKFTS